jgi:hypothetical protein
VVGGTFRWIHPNTSPTTAASIQPAGGPVYRTISAFGGSSVLIKDNDIAAHPDALLLQSGIVAAGTDTDVRVFGNTLRRTDYGIVVAYEAHGTVRRNDVRIGSVNGILLYEDATATITENRATGYHHSIRMEAGGSTITDNDFRGSDARDCLDGTSGGGTKGTANTWARNLGDATPKGICRLP